MRLGSDAASSGVTATPNVLGVTKGLPNMPANSTVISLDSEILRTPDSRVPGCPGSQNTPVVSIGSEVLMRSLQF